MLLSHFLYRCENSKLINPQMNLFIKSIYIQCIDRIAAKFYIHRTQVVGYFEWSSAHSLCMGNFSIKNTQIGIGTWSLKEADQLGTVFTAFLTTVLHYVDKFLPTMFSTILLLFCWIYYIVVGVCYCSLWKNHMGTFQFFCIDRWRRVIKKQPAYAYASDFGIILLSLVYKPKDQVGSF